MSSLPHEEAARILCRVLEALARQNGKTLSAKTRSGVSRSCRGRFADDSASESAKEFFPILTRIERKVSR